MRVVCRAEIHVEMITLSVVPNTGLQILPALNRCQIKCAVEHFVCFERNVDFYLQWKVDVIVEIPHLESKR